MDRAKMAAWFKDRAENTPMPGAKAMYQATYDLLTRSQWISVEERLPEGMDKVLVLFEDGGMMDATYEECIDDESRFGTYRGYYDPDTLGFVDGEWIAYEGVTHWMPLPEPPEGGVE